MKTQVMCSLFIAFSLTMIVPTGLAKEDPKEIVVYSSRTEDLIKPVFDEFTNETGIKIKYLIDKEAVLIERLKAEGKKSPADLFLTVDAGNLWKAAQEGLLQPTTDKVLEKNIPAHLQDPENRWFGLSVRARTIAYSKERVKPSDLSTYEDLAQPQWKGRLCLRTSDKVYNQSLVAMMIEEHGEKKTEEIVKGWVSNLATNVFSSDTKVLEAIAAGQCDVGIVNTYYFGRLAKDKPEVPVALFWPNQGKSGVHVNISGAGVTKYAPHKKEATQLLTWLSGAKAQSLFADRNMEYPANSNIDPHKDVAAWGEFKGSLINVSKAGELQAKAVKLMDRAKYR